MKLKLLFLGIFVTTLFVIQWAYAEPSIQILMEKTTFGYGEKLVYTLEVSEVTGDLAIIHIRDESGKGSSAIPIEITQLSTEIPSLYPFEKQVFSEGKYFIDVQYSGAENTAEFNIVDLGNLVIPFQTKQIAYNWITGQVSGGFFIDSIKKSVEKDAINIPFEIDRENIEKIIIPEWVKVMGVWWLEEKISDDTFAKAFQYLLDKKIIKN